MDKQFVGVISLKFRDLCEEIESAIQSIIDGHKGEVLEGSESLCELKITDKPVSPLVVITVKIKREE